MNEAMRFISSFLQDNWQKQIDGVMFCRILFSEECDIRPEFPLHELHNVTTQYIVSKKERPVRGVADDRLMKLILKSQDLTVAFAACSHLLSQQAIRTLMVRDFARLEAETYLKFVIVAHYGNPNAVDELEYIRAKRILLAFKHANSALFEAKYLRALVELAISCPVPKTSLVHTVMSTAITSFCTRLSASLSASRQDRDWGRCWSLIHWLSSLLHDEQHFPEDCLDPTLLFEQSYFQWRMWSVWQPLSGKTTKYDRPDDARRGLFDILGLEGPDILPNPKSSHFERLMSENLVIRPGQPGPIAVLGPLRVGLVGGTRDEAEKRLRQVHECISYMARLGSYHIDLLINFGLRTFIGVEDQELLSAMMATKDNMFGLLVLESKKSLGCARDTAVRILDRIHINNDKNVRCSALAKWGVRTLEADVLSSQKTYRLTMAEAFHHMKFAELELHKLMMRIRAICSKYKWIPNLMSKPIRSAMENCPTLDHLLAIQRIQLDLQELQDNSSCSLKVELDAYMKNLLVQPGSCDDSSVAILAALVDFWNTNQSCRGQSLSLLLANGKGKFRSDCIAQLHLLQESHFSTLLAVMEGWNNDDVAKNEACVKLVEFLAICMTESTNKWDAQITSVWKPVLYRMLKARGHALIAESQERMSSQIYIKFIRDLHIIFGDKVVFNANLSPPILDPSLYEMIDRLVPFSAVLQRIEQDNVSLTIRYILSSDDSWFLQGIFSHLSALEESVQGPSLMSDISYALVRRLSQKSSNAEHIYNVLCSVHHMTMPGASICNRLLKLFEREQGRLASTLLPLWLRDSVLTDDDQIGLRDVIQLLQIKDDVVTSVADMEALADYLDEQYQELLAEAKRLDYMRIDLKSRDPDGVARLLEQIMIEDTTAMEDAFARLPVPLLNVVEKIDDSHIEIIFPLTDLTLLQKTALGVGNAPSLVVRLFIGDASQPKFCIHFDNEASLSLNDIHSQWTVFKSSRAPEQQICHGMITPVTYQLARVLARYLAGGFKDVLSIHTLVSTSLKTMGAACIICGKHHGVSLRKATVCDAWECTNIFARSPVEVRLAAIRQDPLAVDMLISMIYSAIQSGYHNLLPDCPLNKNACLEVMRTLPSMGALSKAKRFSVIIKNEHAGKTEQFLTWVCCSFKGFLSTATDRLRIPSLPPGILQFVLANCAPVKEMGFNMEFKANSQQSKVVFHGTSIDRLYPILHQGLKIMSGTPLQAYGAAHGPGIYLADEPSTSWLYADRKAATRDNWTKSALNGGRILLGCELTGSTISRGNEGIHVIQKEGVVMVRYIFVVPTETTVLPIASHLTSAMMSVFNSLRSGAL